MGFFSTYVNFNWRILSLNPYEDGFDLYVSAQEWGQHSHKCVTRMRKLHSQNSTTFQLIAYNVMLTNADDTPCIVWRKLIFKDDWLLDTNVLVYLISTCGTWKCSQSWDHSHQFLVRFCVCENSFSRLRYKTVISYFFGCWDCVYILVSFLNYSFR